MKKFLLRTAIITGAIALAWFVGSAVLMGVGPAYPIIANIAAPCAWLYAMYKNTMNTVNETNTKTVVVVPTNTQNNNKNNTNQRVYQGNEKSQPQELAPAPKKKFLGRWHYQGKNNNNQREAA